MSRKVCARDLLQPPTAITLASLTAVLEGAAHIDTRRGKVLMALGRLGDVADGIVARRYNMCSDAGAIADTTADKLGMAALCAGMWRHETAPRPVIAAIAIKHAVNASATLYNGLTDPDKRSIRPPKSGKYGIAADNVSLLAFATAEEFDDSKPAHKILRGLGWAAAAVGLACGIDATTRYIRNDFDTAND